MAKLFVPSTNDVLSYISATIFSLFLTRQMASYRAGDNVYNKAKIMDGYLY